MNTTHTFGPWTSVKRAQDGEYQVQAANGAVVCWPDFWNGAIVEGNTKPEPEIAANARLIAAAPELLAACGMALDVLLSDRYDETSCPVQQLRAVIAKAVKPIA